MKLSVIVPAYNEAAVLAGTLAGITTALAPVGADTELIVVDNASEDTTAEVARQAGARVVDEPVHNIAAVRNAGARVATGLTLVFVDADTQVPSGLFVAILQRLEDPRCQGGAVAVEYDHLERRWMRWYLAGWRFWATLFHFAQGAAQFARREAFAAIGGYDQAIFMGEDIDFYWRLRRLARRTGGCVTVLAEPRVVTSGRRFNRMPLWKVLLLTHPLFIRMAWRRQRWWKDWYVRPVR